MSDDEVIIETNEVMLTEGQDINYTFRDRPDVLNGIPTVSYRDGKKASTVFSSKGIDDVSTNAKPNSANKDE